MALDKVKTEMKGTGGGRWTKREAAKLAANKRRRAIDKRMVGQARQEVSR